jgi:hypothetical protein
LNFPRRAIVLIFLDSAVVETRMANCTTQQSLGLSSQLEQWPGAGKGYTKKEKLVGRVSFR